MKKICFSGFMLSLVLTACSAVTTPTNLNLTNQPISQLRTMQMRHFDQSDSTKALRSIIKTLVSLNFQIVRIDDQSGLIEAIRLENGSIMQANVTLKTIVEHGSWVRIILRYNQQFVTKEQTYQEFFDTLSRNLS